MRACLALLWGGGAATSAAFAEDALGAVGRISYAAVPAEGAAICTGTLVAADLVLTAGHCLRGALDAPEGVWFAAGYHDGQSRALVQGAGISLMDAAGTGGFAEDLALLRLSRPLLPEEAAPLPLADPRVGAFTLMAYRRDAPEQAERIAPCRAVNAPVALLGLTCPVVSGNSGGPVLQRNAAGWQVVAVVVASASDGPQQALAAIPAPALRARLTEDAAGLP